MNHQMHQIIGIFSLLFMVVLVCLGAGCVYPINSQLHDNNNSKLFIVGSDFQTGILQWMAPNDDSLAMGNLHIFQDSRLKQCNGMLYILECKGADNVIKYDPLKENHSGIIYQQHLGANWNPVDMQVIDDQKAYIACENNPAIAIIDPSNGSLKGQIDISKYAFIPDSGAPETNPHACRVAFEGNNLYVGLQRLDKNFRPGFNSLILVIDVRSDSVIDTIQLKSKNLQDIKIVDGKLYATCPNDAYMTVGDGDIEAVDCSNHSVNTVVGETPLNGNPLLFVHKYGSLFYVQTYRAWQDVKVLEVDFSSGTVVDSVPGVINAYGGIYFDQADSLLFVGEQGGADAPAAEIKVFKNNKLIRRIASRLPPYGFELIHF